MKHLILLALIVGIAHCGSLVHVQPYPSVPVVRYENTYVPVQVSANQALYAAPLHSHLVNPYVGAYPYHVAPVSYSRQVSLLLELSLVILKILSRMK